MSGWSQYFLCIYEDHLNFGKNWHKWRHDIIKWLHKRKCNEPVRQRQIFQDSCISHWTFSFTLKLEMRWIVLKWLQRISFESERNQHSLGNFIIWKCRLNYIYLGRSIPKALSNDCYQRKLQTRREMHRPHRFSKPLRSSTELNQNSWLNHEHRVCHNWCYYWESRCRKCEQSEAYHVGHHQTLLHC